MTDRERRCKIQSLDKHCGLIGPAIAVGILEDLDLIGTPRPARRGLGLTIVFGAKILIDRHRLESGRVGVLEILDDP